MDRVSSCFGEVPPEFSRGATQMNVLGAKGCSEERHSITGSRALEMTLSQTLFTETENRFMDPNHLTFGDS